MSSGGRSLEINFRVDDNPNQPDSDATEFPRFVGSKTLQAEASLSVLVDPAMDPAWSPFFFCQVFREALRNANVSASLKSIFQSAIRPGRNP